MTGANVLIISPSFPPAPGGLGDYSIRLANELEKQVTVHFLGLRQVEPIAGINYEVLGKTPYALNEFVKIKGITHIFLNYSNYGYHQKGVPFWLVKAVNTVKKDNRVVLITFFHEIYASGKFWQSSFWLHPFQKFIFRKLYEVSNFSLCSNQRVSDLIAGQVEDNGVKNLNIGLFSNIPEPTIMPEWDRRRNVAIVFGTIGRRQEIYNKPKLLNSWIQANGIEEIWDIGSGNPLLSDLISARINRMGKKSGHEVSQLMQLAIFGLIDYTNSLLGKSGIFAAYAAHGLAVVNFTSIADQALDGLEIGKHFLAPGHELINGEKVGLLLNHWYKAHNLQEHTSKIISILNHESVVTLAT